MNFNLNSTLNSTLNSSMRSSVSTPIISTPLNANMKNPTFLKASTNKLNIKQNNNNIGVAKRVAQPIPKKSLTNQIDEDLANVVSLGYEDAITKVLAENEKMKIALIRLQQEITNLLNSHYVYANATTTLPQLKMNTYTEDFEENLNEKIDLLKELKKRCKNR